MSGRQVEFARTIQGAGTDLLNLISDILDLSKIESGTVTVDAEEVLMTSLVEAIARPFRHEAETRQLSFEVAIDPHLARSITTDSKRLQQVLKNLLSNAFKFTEQGGVRLSVSAPIGGWSPERAILNQAPAVVAFEVSDTGIGIPPEKQRIIFEAFQQADASTSRKYGGTGLGLAISRELANLLGGEISLKSSVGKGSTFTLYLPLKYVGPATALPMRAHAAMQPPILHLPPPAERPVETIPDDRLDLEPGDSILLIVEDDPHYARVVMDLARDKGFKVLLAMRGGEALELAKQFQPSAVSLDVFLPDMLGWTVLSQLKQNPLTRHIPVQIITLDEDRQHALARGAFSFVMKPTTTEGLDAALGRIQEYAQPRRKRLLVVEDNAAERMSIGELLGHDDIEIVMTGTGEGALTALREQPCDCVVLDLRLPDLSGFEVLERIANEPSLSEVPVVVFTGRELSAEEDAQLHSMARSIVVKGVESPERLLDETALFLHRVVTDLPAEKQRMLERLTSSDEDLVGRTVLLVDDDARNIFALSSVLERRGMHVLTATTGREAIAIVEFDPGARHRPHGHHDAGHGRLSDDEPHPAEAASQAPADHRPDGQGHEGRPREVPRGRRLRLSGEAGQHRTAAGRAAALAASVSAGRPEMRSEEKINILLVDDQPAKLLSYEVILRELGENLITAASGREALQLLLKNEIAVILVDVSMPELDGFQLAAMVREHPRYQKTAIIFVSAIHLTETDALRGYEMGAVDYVPVPVVPEVLRAKVRVFAELYRKSRELGNLNRELEQRVAERTAELEMSSKRLIQSEQLRSLALAAGEMGSWHWDAATGECAFDEGQCRIFGVEGATFEVTPQSVRSLIHPADLPQLDRALAEVTRTGEPYQAEFRVRRPSGEERWCRGTAVGQFDDLGRLVRLSGVTADMTGHKEAEAHQALLTREVDHRARNALAVVQSIVRLTRAESMQDYIAAVEGRIGALARAHVLLSRSRWEGADLAKLVAEEMAPYDGSEHVRVTAIGPEIVLDPATAQILALALHELATNAAKYGALSQHSGTVTLSWAVGAEGLVLQWTETGGPRTEVPMSRGYGTRVIKVAVEQQLGGQIDFDWRGEGLHCRVSIPRSKSIRHGVGPADRAEGGSAGPLALAGNAVLLVEDELLVALMMENTLVEAGFKVVGPAHRLAEAMHIAMGTELNAAVLDINLAGELVYPLADLLAARQVPFIFVTGYGAEGVHPRFAHVPVLQKPLGRGVIESAFALMGNGAGPLPGSPASRAAF